MHESVKSEWIKALRSGKYRQCYGVEARVVNDWKTEYCAIGVLGALFKEEKEVDPFMSLTGENREASLKISHPEFAKWFGSKAWPPSELHGDMEDAHTLDLIVEMNDSEHLTFKQIADELESGNV